MEQRGKVQEALYLAYDSHAGQVRFQPAQLSVQGLLLCHCLLNCSATLTGEKKRGAIHYAPCRGDAYPGGA